MPKLTPALSTIEPDPALLNKLAWVKRVSLAVVALIAAVTLTAWLLPVLGRVFPNGWQLMKADSALAALLSALCLLFSEPGRSRRMHQFSLVLAFAVALLGAFELIGYGLQFSLSGYLAPFLAHGSQPMLPRRMAPQTAAGFALLGIAMILIRSRKPLAVRIADLLFIPLSLLTLILVSGYVFGAMHIFGLSTVVLTSPQTLICLLLLTLVALIRRAENGIFSIFLGHGMGSRIARTLAPILLVLSFLRLIARAHLVVDLKIPESYANAIFASVATIVSLGLLLFLAWRINSMEMEIQNLSIRDALTGLYNLRGFNLLAEQSLRQAHRNQLPFSVLFIDLDNLKQVNDSLGHDAGSAFLAETGEILKATFREIDVLGRIGGDEFGVVGQFSRTAISIAVERLQAACALRNRDADQRFPLSFSIGCVTSVEHENESLKDLMASADKAMYEEKRRKKALLH
jgi:diguanylate cyclase (GGDEF)-like protein